MNSQAQPSVRPDSAWPVQWAVGEWLECVARDRPGDSVESVIVRVPGNVGPTVLDRYALVLARFGVAIAEEVKIVLIGRGSIDQRGEWRSRSDRWS